MKFRFSLASSVSTDNPALIIVRDNGYAIKVSVHMRSDGETTCIYIAENQECYFAANSGPELLGLICIWDKFGSDWNRQEPDMIEGKVERSDESEDDEAMSPS